MEILKVENVFRDLPQLETPRLLRDVVYEKGCFKSLKTYLLLKEEYRVNK